jgi:hypothetical protein
VAKKTTVRMAGGGSEATSRLSEVRTKAVERDYKPRHMKRVPDKDTLAIERNNCQTATKNWKVRVVSHADMKIGDQFILREGSQLVWEHVVGSAQVGNRELTRRTRKNQRGRHVLDERYELLREHNAAGGQNRRENGQAS